MENKNTGSYQFLIPLQQRNTFIFRITVYQKFNYSYFGYSENYSAIQFKLILFIFLFVYVFNNNYG